MDLLPVEPNPRGGCTPSWKILKEYISGMGYQFHEREQLCSIMEVIWKRMHKQGVIRLVTIYIICSFIQSLLTDFTSTH